MAEQLTILPEFQGGKAHMTCADNLDYMRDLPSESMKLIVTSPPYNIGKAYETRSNLQSGENK